MKPTDNEIVEVVNRLAFVVESIAYLQGKERELLPLADKARELVERMQACES